MINCLYVGVGGFIGSIFRYLISVLCPTVTAAFPLVTMLINFTGSLLIGMVAVFSSRIMPIDSKLMLLLTVGICGGFTTFSTFSLEVMTLLEDGKLFLGFSYAILSVLICLIGVYLGRWLILLISR